MGVVDGQECLHLLTRATDGTLSLTHVDSAQKAKRLPYQAGFLID